MHAPLTLRSLYSRRSILGSLGVGLYQTLDKHGLRLPAQRLMAEECLTSAATLSRRLSDPGMMERVIQLVVRTRAQAFPAVHPMDDTLDSWLPVDEVELGDARVWLALQHLALRSPQVATFVVDAWTAQRRRLRDHALRDRSLSPTALEAVHALIEGLVVRRCVEAGFTHQDAVAVLVAAADALASTPDPPASHPAECPSP